MPQHRIHVTQEVTCAANQQKLKSNFCFHLHSLLQVKFLKFIASLFRIVFIYCKIATFTSGTNCTSLSEKLCNFLQFTDFTSAGQTQQTALAHPALLQTAVLALPITFCHYGP